jgi:hypothetical protein
MRSSKPSVVFPPERDNQRADAIASRERLGSVSGASATSPSRKNSVPTTAARSSRLRAHRAGAGRAGWPGAPRWRAAPPRVPRRLPPRLTRRAPRPAARTRAQASRARLRRAGQRGQPAGRELGRRIGPEQDRLVELLRNRLRELRADARPDREAAVGDERVGDRERRRELDRLQCCPARPSSRSTNQPVRITRGRAAHRASARARS